MAVITQTITKREGDLCFSFFMSIMLSSFLSFLYPPSLPLSVEYYAVQWSILSVYLSVLFIFVRPQAVC